MSRGVRKSADEKLSMLDSEITEIENHKSKIEDKIKELKDQRQELLDKQKLEQASKLLDVLNAAGKTPEDIAAMLKNDSKETA